MKKATFKITPSNFKNNINPSCVLPISVGQPYHEGDKFEATIKLINKKFKTCEIIVCDTLHKYNMDNNYDLALQSGNDWLERNIPILNRVKSNCLYTISRWDDWINKDKFNEYKKEILGINDCEYLNSLEESITKYVDRQNDIRLRENSLEYLIEECAVVPLMFDSGFQYHIYPNVLTPVLEKTIRYYQKLRSNNLSEIVIIRFKKLKNK